MLGLRGTVRLLMARTEDKALIKIKVIIHCSAIGESALLGRQRDVYNATAVH